MATPVAPAQAAATQTVYLQFYGAFSTRPGLVPSTATVSLILVCPTGFTLDRDRTAKANSLYAHTPGLPIESWTTGAVVRWHPHHLTAGSRTLGMEAVCKGNIDSTASKVNLSGAGTIGRLRDPRLPTVDLPLGSGYVYGSKTAPGWSAKVRHLVWDTKRNYSGRCVDAVQPQCYGHSVGAMTSGRYAEVKMAVDFTFIKTG